MPKSRRNRSRSSSRSRKTGGSPTRSKTMRSNSRSRNTKSKKPTEDFTAEDRADFIQHINDYHKEADTESKKKALSQVSKMHYKRNYKSPFFGKVNPEDRVYTQGIHRIDAFFKYGDNIA